MPAAPRKPPEFPRTGWWSALLEYLGAGRWRRKMRVTSTDELRRFLETRSNYVAQISLYGYLRTRAGMRYPELFDNEEFVRSINAAKWQIWLACLGDLAIYMGGMLALGARDSAADVPGIVQHAVERILDETGTPADAGDAFGDGVHRVRARLANRDWRHHEDDDSAFAESPDALVRWAPIVDELKQLDEEIVRNSVRFRWQEIRREVRAMLDARAVMASRAT